MDKYEYYLKKAYKIFSKNEMRVLPGNIAFFFALAIIPIVTIIILIASKLSISMDTIIHFIVEFFPEGISTTIVDVIAGKGFDTSIGIFNFIAFFVASNGTYAIINASNALYKVKDRDILKDRIKSVLLLIILISLIVFLLAVPLFGNKILSLFGNSSFVNKIDLIVRIFKWPVSIFLIYVNLKLIYTIAPSKKIESKTTTYGSIFTTIIWVIATAIFGYYLKYFGNYNIIYGNLSSMIILMIWLYIISYVFILGIAINVTNSDK